MAGCEVPVVVAEAGFPGTLKRLLDGALVDAVAAVDEAGG